DPKPRRGLSGRWGWLALVALVLLADVFAFVAFPQVSNAGAADCPFPAFFSQNALEFPAPGTVYDFAPPAPPAGDLVTFHPSISNTILTMWICLGVALRASL